MSLIDDDDASPPADWIVTYGDMMSLLLTFFILLVSMGEIQKRKYEALVESIRRSFGSSAGAASGGPGSPMLKGMGASNRQTPGQPKSDGGVKKGTDADGPRGPHHRTVIIRPGRNPTLGGVIYFDETSSELSPQNREVLQRTANLFRGKLQKVEIRGHTSTYPLPPDSPYANHWDLAYARCMHSMEYLSQLGVDPKRIRIAVAASNEPLHTSPDPLLRKENSRVEIFMLDEFVEGGNEPSGGK
ncbi:MAG: flagellar motor protein MotB [Thermoguttaceae bacterium]|jgi:chemotaxis protein MotB